MLQLSAFGSRHKLPCYLFIYCANDCSFLSSCILRLSVACLWSASLLLVLGPFLLLRLFPSSAALSQRSQPPCRARRTAVTPRQRQQRERETCRRSGHHSARSARGADSRAADRAAAHCEKLSSPSVRVRVVAVPSLPPPPTLLPHSPPPPHPPRRARPAAAAASQFPLRLRCWARGPTPPGTPPWVAVVRVAVLSTVATSRPRTPMHSAP